MEVCLCKNDAKVEYYIKNLPLRVDLLELNCSKPNRPDNTETWRRLRLRHPSNHSGRLFWGILAPPGSSLKNGIQQFSTILLQTLTTIVVFKTPQEYLDTVGLKPENKCSIWKKKPKTIHICYRDYYSKYSQNSKIALFLIFPKLGPYEK